MIGRTRLSAGLRRLGLVQNPHISAPRLYRKSSPMNAYVGEGSVQAQEYHDSDFDFEEHKKEMQPILGEFNSQPTSHHPTLSPPSQAPEQAPTSPRTENEWERFYRAHPNAKFFKERRYLLLEFPDLTIKDPPQHFVELGCGCGSSILPVLNANQQATATVCDISATSVQQLQLAAAASCGTRIADAFVADAADPSLRERLLPLNADGTLIMFTLSAVLPSRMPDMLLNAFASLRPGGKLFIRDHGVYDMVQMRLRADQRIGPSTYRLADGTISHFFSVEELGGVCEEVGFEVLECKYVCVINENKKKGIKLKRVFVHGVFQKPHQ